MFGATIDYWLLRPLVDSACPAYRPVSEVADDPELETERARARFRKWNARVNRGIPINPDFRYLDVGCGCGDLAVAMSLEGCGHVTGITLHPRGIRRAAEFARRAGVEDRVAFACRDIHALPGDWKFDVVVSHEALEHITRPREFLVRIADHIVTNESGGGGILILAFGPLFHSPLGSHDTLNFFRFYIPWAVVLFSEQAMLRLRREFFAPLDRATAYEDIERGRAGLNRLRYTEFLRYVKEAGLVMERLVVNPQLERFPILHRLSEWLVRIPLVRDYVATSVYAVLRKPAM